MNCCRQQHGINQIFTPRAARAEADEFRKKGLNERDRLLAQALVQRGVKDATVLEIGGGVGGMQIELLKAGAARTIDVDIAQSYVQTAQELAQSLGFGGQMEHQVLDFAREADRVQPAEVVIMNRVICCYHDMPALVTPAAQHARRMLALVFPREAWWMSVGEKVMNFGMWLIRLDFRAFMHSHREIIAIVSGNGLRPTLDQHSGFWRMMIFERT